MNKGISDRRMAENEVVFRRRNERLHQGFQDLHKIAEEDSQEHLLASIDIPLSFYCECSDENCQKRIEILPSAYQNVHKYRDRFVILLGHEVRSIERIIRRNDAYCIVEKYKTPREDVASLKPTPVDNS